MQDLIFTQGLFFIGNGRVAMGGDGADIVQLFAPCYSIPGVMTLRLADSAVTARNHRIRGSAGYLTKLFETDRCIGKITDYTHPTLPVFIRRVQLERPVEFLLASPFRAVNTDNLYGGHAKARLFEIPDGTVVFSKSKTDKETFCQILFSPNCEMRENVVVFPEGESCLMFVGGDYGSQGTHSFAGCIELSKSMLTADLDEIYSDFGAHWQRILASIRVDRDALAPIFDSDELVEAVATALITQTSAEGGVIAGAFYHLAYGRDMYGVFRAYMTLGLYDYARRMVEYMCGIYREKGYMPNASGMGMSCSHRHENDNVEQTGYYLLELLDYVEQTKDTDFLRNRMDYALYLLEAQEGQLKKGMIPFNGDETYIAGGIFPRSGIDHGSMEATALYIGSATRLMDVCERYGLMENDKIAIHRRPLGEAKSLFVQNFTDGDTVYINNPYRAEAGNTPAYRHGVCHRCQWMTNLIRAPGGGYLCAACYGQTSAPMDGHRYNTDCALWMSVFTGCCYLPEHIIRTALDRTLCRLRDSEFGKTVSENTVGYEIGVILYTLAEYLPPHELPAYRDLLNELLKDRVPGLVWVEYYKNGEPNSSSCPYRPWESGMNFVSILKYCCALKALRA